MLVITVTISANIYIPLCISSNYLDCEDKIYELLMTASKLAVSLPHFTSYDPLLEIDAV